MVVQEIHVDAMSAHQLKGFPKLQASKGEMNNVSGGRDTSAVETSPVDEPPDRGQDKGSGVNDLQVTPRHLKDKLRVTGDHANHT